MGGSDPCGSAETKGTSSPSFERIYHNAYERCGKRKRDAYLKFALSQERWKRRKPRPARSVQSLGPEKLSEVVDIFGQYQRRSHVCDWLCAWNWCPNYRDWMATHPDTLTYTLELAFNLENKFTTDNPYIPWIYGDEM